MSALGYIRKTITTMRSSENDVGGGGGGGSSGSDNSSNNDNSSGATLVEAARSSESASRQVHFRVWLYLAPVSKLGAPLLLAGTMRLHAGPGGRLEEEEKNEGDEESRSYCGSTKGLEVRRLGFVGGGGTVLSTDQPAAASRIVTRANFFADCARRRREDNEAGGVRADGWVSPFGGHCEWFHTAGMVPGEMSCCTRTRAEEAHSRQAAPDANFSWQTVHNVTCKARASAKVSQ